MGSGMSKINSMIVTTIFSVLILSMVISPTYPTLIPAYAAPPETPTLDVKCEAEANSGKPVTADCQLLNLLNEEIAARIAADIILQENIDAEEKARIEADDILQGNINAEEAARKLADDILQGNIDAEEAARIADVDKEEADRIADVDKEEADRIADVDKEEADRIAEDNLLKNRATALETRATELEEMGNKTIDATKIALKAAIAIFATGAAACTFNLVPACAAAFGALGGVAVAALLIMDEVEF